MSQFERKPREHVGIFSAIERCFSESGPGISTLFHDYWSPSLLQPMSQTPILQTLVRRPTMGEDAGQMNIHEPVTEEIIEGRAEDGAESLAASIDRPPSEAEKLPAAKIYAPLSFPVLALLAPASVFGVLARLGLQGLTTYDGQSVFSLAYAQTIGCFIMGFCLSFKEPIGNLYVFFSVHDLK
jgi:hypothetical protein